MSTIPTNNNKLQRIAEQSLHISNLPDGILTHAASYLATPSRSLFAVAMTTSSKSWAQDNFSIGSKRQQTVASILSSGVWDVLDFGDIEKSLVIKLTEDDVHAVLKCISAQDVLKKLRLTGCVYITGQSLEVLRGSSTIEYIDLSLVNLHESPEINEPMISSTSTVYPMPSLSEEIVLPILESVIDADDNSLKMIMLPKKWRENKSDTLCQFLIKFEDFLATRQTRCSKCNLVPNTLDDLGWICQGQDNIVFGLQNFSCHKCTGCFCYACDYEEEGPLNYCKLCERDYCEDCVEAHRCQVCDETFCSACSSVKECLACGLSFCNQCHSRKVCSSCGLIYHKDESLCSNCDSGDDLACFDCHPTE